MKLNNLNNTVNLVIYLLYLKKINNFIYHIIRAVFLLVETSKYISAPSLLRVKPSFESDKFVLKTFIRK